MVKAKVNKKIVASYKNLEEACSAMVKEGLAVNVAAARVNITAAINGTEGRSTTSAKHPISGQPRKTAYGFTWNVTKR